LGRNAQHVPSEGRSGRAELAAWAAAWGVMRQCHRGTRGQPVGLPGGPTARRASRLLDSCCPPRQRMQGDRGLASRAQSVRSGPGE
jgi:hypothetical protein